MKVINTSNRDTLSKNDKVFLVTQEKVSKHKVLFKPKKYPNYLILRNGYGKIQVNLNRDDLFVLSSSNVTENKQKEFIAYQIKILETKIKKLKELQKLL